MLKLLISNSWEAFVGFWVGHHILFPFYVFFMYLNAQEEKQVYYFKISKILVETNRKQFQRLKIYNGIKYALNEFEEFYSGHGSRRQYTVQRLLNIMEWLNVRIVCLWIVFGARSV